MEKNTTRACVICGKSFVPYPAKRDTQKTCSSACRKKYNSKRASAKYYANLEANREKNRTNRRAQRQGSSICKICGKPIIHSFDLGDIKVRMHRECIIDDCLQTLKAGKTLTHTQWQRLYARGYTVTEFKTEFANELQ